MLEEVHSNDVTFLYILNQIAVELVQRFTAPSALSIRTARSSRDASFHTE